MKPQTREAPWPVQEPMGLGALVSDGRSNLHFSAFARPHASSPCEFKSRIAAPLVVFIFARPTDAQSDTCTLLPFLHVYNSTCSF